MKKAYHYWSLFNSSTTTSLQQPNDPYSRFQWSLFTMNVFEAWRVTSGNSNQAGIVIDTGGDYTHPDLGDQQNKSLSKDLIDNDDDTQDTCGNAQCFPDGREKFCSYHGTNMIETEYHCPDSEDFQINIKTNYFKEYVIGQIDLK